MSGFRIPTAKFCRIPDSLTWGDTQRVVYRKPKTHSISDSLALRSSCASLLTSAAVSVIWFSDGSRSSAHSFPPLTPRDRIEVKVYLKKQPGECNMEGSTSHWKLLVYAWYNLVGFLSQTDRTLFCKNVTSLARSDSGTSPLLTAVCLNNFPSLAMFSVQRFGLVPPSSN